jgi:RNA polymerase sigma-70 factor, ECF subfamily
MDDNFYINQVIEGNRQAFATLVEQHKDMVFTIAVKILRSREDAEEVAQDVFVKAFNALPTFKGEAKFSTWLYRIAYNTAISHTRRSKPVFSAIDDRMIDNYTTDSISKNVNERSTEEQIEAVNFVLDSLPEEENLMITLFYKKQKSIDEISEITGYGSSNVKVKLFRIRKKMYEELDRYFEKAKV